VRYAVLLVAATAAADPKPRPDRYTEAARTAFDQARAADDAGKLGEAVYLYKKANAISEDEATVYNIADVERRLNNIDEAITWYEKYLTLAHDAKDRNDAGKLVDKLIKTPGTLAIASDSAGTVFVDGAELGNVPTDREVSGGEHVVELVTPATYGVTTCTAVRGGKRDCKVSAPTRVDGNLILSYHAQHAWDESNVHWQTLRRIQVPAGHYELSQVSRDPCTPVVFDVPADGLLYVHVEQTHADRCGHLTVAKKVFALK